MKLISCLAVALVVPIAVAQTANHLESGNTLFLQKCAFCHGRDAGGGETGPDLTRSDLVKGDVQGDKITPVIRNGRPDKGMPPFALSEQDIGDLVLFIHERKRIADSQHGGRKGVSDSDLQTGNAELGKQYFNGAGGCSNCHSPEGDLAKVATKYSPLRLERRMLYPEKAPAKTEVTLPSGESVKGELAYQDEFTIAVHDSAGNFRSWPTSSVKFKVDEPAAAHEALLSKYTDDDIHNLMAYLQTLR
jgi:cytochrome c oxidase cbb3-type subunit III